jgi:RNA polymerase sigma-70 factor (ECF subfamily)
MPSKNSSALGSRRLDTESLWTRLRDDLFRFIRRRVKDEHDAEDLLQEAFVRIHRRLESVKEADRVTAWVFRIAQNAVVDHLRASRRKPTSLAGDAPLADKRGPGTSASDAIAGSLEAMVEKLPEPYREALRLSELEGLPQRQVAERLGITLPAVKSRIQRGRRLLRRMLLECCRFEFDRRGNIVEFERRKPQEPCNCELTPPSPCDTPCGSSPPPQARRRP